MAKMDPNSLMFTTVSEARLEALELLSNSWCNFAIQALQDQSSAYSSNHPMSMFETDNLKAEKCMKMDDADYTKSMPWKSDYLKSWIWMKQAMHSDVNYSAGHQKRWAERKRSPCIVSIKKWVKEMKEKQKGKKRLKNAEVHAAVSIAGLAAALAAIAEENSKEKLVLEKEQNSIRKTALASAAALVASQCVQMAEFMGAKRAQLSTVISSALSGTSTSDILTLTAVASTSLRGAATLKARAGCKNRALKGAPVLPIDMDHSKLDDADDELDFDKRTKILAKGAMLTIATAQGKSMVRLVSLHLNTEAKVIVRIVKHTLLNVITSKKECVVLSLHAEICKDSKEGRYNTCHRILLTTSRGTIKLDMADDCQQHKMWATTINQMLVLSTSLTK